MREVFHPQYRPPQAAHVTLAGFDDRRFEQFVFDEVNGSVARQAREIEAACVVTLTQRAGDEGRDVVVRNFHGDALLGFRYEAPPGEIIIECKFVSGHRLSLEHVSANLVQLKETSSVFLLVTNATLTPKSLSLIQAQCERLGATFQLIDAYNFERHFPGTRSAPDNARLLVSYQVLPAVEPDSAGFTAHIVVRSFETQRLDVRIALQSTAWWRLSGPPLPLRSLNGDGIACFTFRLRPKRSRLSHRISFVLTLNNVVQPFRLDLTTADDPIELPLFGRLADFVVNYRSKWRQRSAPDVLLLHAPSGTGKSRFLAEIARIVGPDRVLWLVVRDDGSAVVKSDASVRRGTKNLRFLPQIDVLARIKRAKPGSIVAVFIDDLHLADSHFLDELESWVFEQRERSRIILAGRSDPPSRRPRYEAFAHVLQDNTVAGGAGLQYMTLPNVSADDISGLLQRLLPDEIASAVVSSTVSGDIRPVEVVQYIHSLLERGFMYWADEDRLAVASQSRDVFDIEGFAPFTSSLLDARIQFLEKIAIEDFTLQDLFALLALSDDPALNYGTLEELKVRGISPEFLSYWFREDRASRLAFVAHDTITERLIAHSYDFGKPLRLGRVLHTFPAIADRLSDTTRALVALHARDVDAATPAMSRLATKLIRVRNISSLPLEDVGYNDVGALLFFLELRSHRLPLVHRAAMIARAYLDMHHQDFVSGLLDCLRLLSTGDERNSNHLTQLAVRQLMAHGLLNSGDHRTAVSLMHNVENALVEMRPSRLAHAVAFDMCDRLQGYYKPQSAFDLARSFFLRGRSHAVRARDEALINLSLSNEFHLHRYLDAAFGIELALRQRRHAEKHAPPRAHLHAIVNEEVATWSAQSDIASAATVARLEEVRTTSLRRGYGHLVPRIDYLFAVDAYRRHVASMGTSTEITERIMRVYRSAQRFGYGEYIWLADNLRLLAAILRGEDAAEITILATTIIDHLVRDGLAFVGGDYLCFQNVVVLSNAARALATYIGEEAALAAVRLVHFSPLVVATPNDRERRLASVFEGDMLVKYYDPTAIRRDRDGYFTILV